MGTNQSIFINMQVSGILKFRSDFQKKTENFGYKEIWVETIEQYPQTVVIHLANDRSDLADPYQIGQEIKVSLNLKGKPYQDKNTGEWKCFTSIHGWKVEAVVKNQPQQPSYAQPQQGYSQHPSYGGVQNYGNQTQELPQQHHPQQGYQQAPQSYGSQQGFQQSPQGYGQPQSNGFPPSPDSGNQQDPDFVPF